jgi:hypothetical protein
MAPELSDGRPKMMKKSSIKRLFLAIRQKCSPNPPSSMWAWRKNWSQKFDVGSIVNITFPVKKCAFHGIPRFQADPKSFF